MLPQAGLRTLGITFALATAAAAAAPSAAARPEWDITASIRPSPVVTAALARLQADPELARVGTPVHVDERYGVPNFVWGTRSSAATPSARGGVRPTPEQAARDHLVRLAPYYRLDEGDVRSATLRYVHDTGRGGIIVSFLQTVDGVEVFRDEVKVMMSRDLNLVAVSGYIPGRAEAGKATARAFRTGAEEAIGRALDDFAEVAADRGAIRRAGPAPGGYQKFMFGVPGQALPAGLDASEPIRSKRVLFHLPDRLVPAFYIELMSEADKVAYVISSDDGNILFRHGLMATDSYGYRVWADGTGIMAPFDGPQGNMPSPHPTGLPDLYTPSFLTPSLVSLQNGPISTNDPWLPPAAAETNGNNVDAYADLFAPDGLSAGDFRASITSANTFDRTYNTSQSPVVSAAQRMAAITQLFYDNNFFHDWYYDAGFNEASGNAQTSNYGRGGVEGDNLRVEAQDYSGLNNANMTTPADGARPVMQMFVFTHDLAKLIVNSPAGVAGDKAATTANFGPQAFSVTGDVVLVDDGVGPSASDGCQAILNPVAGKIALIDRGNCLFIDKALNAQAAGAVAVVIVNSVPGLFYMTGTAPVTIPLLMISQADGAAIKAALQSGAVNATLSRVPALSRDATIDNQIVAHEWGHYISNRLIGNASGLSNNQGRGLGEGWADFHAMLMSVKPGDDFSGAYALVAYSLQNSLQPGNEYYFGIRRYPYSTDFGKNPLTFQHIQNGVPLPAGPPISFGASGSDNAEEHNTGEVWCAMLWECYAELLRDTGRLTFDQARDRMRNYLVAAYKMTPNAPTLVEARDALLAAASASDATDYGEFCAAFSRRGAGLGAIAPDRNSTTNVGVVESYICGGGNLQLVSATLNDAVHPCDSDGYLDEGEVGYFTVTLGNIGTTNLSATTATLSSGNPSVVFQSGTTLAFPPSQPNGTTTASAFVRSSGATGVQVEDIQIQYNDPGLAVAGPRTSSFSVRGNVDEIPSTGEYVEAAIPTWTMSGSAGGSEPWQRIEVSTTNHQFHATDPGEVSDQYLVSPPIVVGTGAFGFTFQHAYSFQFGYDGGVVEVSDNGGASWTDIGASVTPGYGGTIFTGSGNPLGGRLAFVSQSAGYPALGTATADLGTAYAGGTVRIRFRLGADFNTGAPGWYVDNLVFTGLLNQPFLDVGTDPGPCTPVAVGDPLPTELSFTVAGANPAMGRASFRFALPQGTRVRITIHDVSGRRVATVADGEFGAGAHAVSWTSVFGGKMPRPGVYFARMAADGRELKRRLVVLSR